MTPRLTPKGILIACPMCTAIFYTGFSEIEFEMINLENTELQVACENCDYLITYEISFIATNEH